MTLNQSFLFLFSCLFLSSCIDSEDITEVDEMIIGLKAVYVNIDTSNIESQAPKSFVDLGKFVYREPHLFINERFQGIHVLDNTDPTDPLPLSFINIPGNSEFTISQNLLYADNGRDLYTIDITDVTKVKLLSITEDIYQAAISDQLFPDDYFGFFECVDTTKGIVVGWEEATLTEPKCWR